MEILDSAQMDRAVAMWAAYTYVVGNLEEMLPRLQPGEEAPTQEVRPARTAEPPGCFYGSGLAKYSYNVMSCDGADERRGLGISTV